MALTGTAPSLIYEDPNIFGKALFVQIELAAVVQDLRIVLEKIEILIRVARRRLRVENVGGLAQVEVEVILVGALGCGGPRAASDEPIDRH